MKHSKEPRQREDMKIHLEEQQGDDELNLRQRVLKRSRTQKQDLQNFQVPLF